MVFGDNVLKQTKKVAMISLDFITRFMMHLKGKIAIKDVSLFKKLLLERDDSAVKSSY